ncbi:pyridoxamine 5'-phosphate oxidase family protein [Actinophytocola glycyrrhizae]|uniref:Pyridoxamine 5'-phosphate oxidase family protein n=1 Tax=Actinophytocola glycyrrhizae TaxID=2044873 RepID=A0ABV9S3F1_9PSEU
MTDDMTDTVAQGDPRLLDTDVAQRRLTALGPLRLAYVALDGTPRVVPVLFHWNGEEIVMGGFAPSARGRALRAKPRVALTLDTDEQSPEVLSLRGDARVTEVRGVVPEYETYMRAGMPAEAADAYFAELRARDMLMERITVRPDWVAVIDFRTRFPAAMPEWLRS